MSLVEDKGSFHGRFPGSKDAGVSWFERNGFVLGNDKATCCTLWGLSEGDEGQCQCDDRRFSGVRDLPEQPGDV